LDGGKRDAGHFSELPLVYSQQSPRGTHLASGDHPWNSFASFIQDIKTDV
jgi:hypothetical protein